MKASPHAAFAFLAASLLFACVAGQNPLFGRPELRLYIKNNCPTDVRVVVGGETVEWDFYTLHSEPTFDGSALVYWYVSRFGLLVYSSGYS